MAKRDEIMGTHKDMSYNEYATEIGKLWRSMPEEDKGPWKELAMEDKARYEAELVNYRDPIWYGSDSDSDSGGKNMAKKNLDPSSILPARSAYQFLFNQKRDEVMSSRTAISNNVSHNDCASIIGKLWRNMPLEEKQVSRTQVAHSFFMY